MNIQRTVPVGLSRDAKHVYTSAYPSEPIHTLPSVTSILQVVSKPALVPWAQGIVAEAAIAHRGDLDGWVGLGGVDGAVGLLKRAATEHRDKAAAVGSEVHALAEKIVRGEPLPPLSDVLQPFVMAYVRWMEAFAPEFLAAEAMVVGDGYAGTLDGIAVIAGETWLLDTKTAKGTYADTALQLAAYGHAHYIGRPADPVKYAIPPIDQYGVVHVRPEGAELIPYDVTDAEYAAFLSFRDGWRWQSGRAKSVIGQPIGPALVKFQEKVPA